MTRRAAALLVALLTAPAAGATPPHAGQDAEEQRYDLRAGAWDRSVQLERAGQLREARALLVRAWGEPPTGYEVSVRLAWLSLRLGDARRAVREYHRARMLPGAGPEATRGLSSALTLEGYNELAAGDPGGAREDWRQALELDPSQADARHGLDLARAQRVDPELWGGYLGERFNGTQGNGFSIFTVLPLQLSDHFRLRAAYRFSWLELHGPRSSSSSQALGTAAMGPGGGAGGMGPGGGSGSGSGGQSSSGASSSARNPWHEHDAYLGFGFGGTHAWLDLLGFALFPSDEPSVPGQAAELRLGRRFGITTLEATLHREQGWNGQVAPRLFAWPVTWLGLSAGPRFTFDDQGQPASGEATLALLTGPVHIYVRGHIGTQRWPVSPAIPLVLATDQDLPLGGSAALLFRLSSRWTLGLSSELERLALGEVHGTYTSFAAGLRWSPRFWKEKSR